MVPSVGDCSVDAGVCRCSLFGSSGRVAIQSAQVINETADASHMGVTDGRQFDLVLGVN
jgi:hypothetical protein